MTTSHDADLLSCTWRTTAPSSVRIEPLDGAGWASALELARCLEEPPDANASIGSAFEAVAASFVPAALLKRAGAHRATPELLAVARAIERLSVQLHERPGLSDLARELGMEDKRASELAARYFRQYHATVEGWREYLHGLRLELGISAMRSRRLGAQEVARWLGFRAPSSFSHAFQRAGLPVPSSLRAEPHTVGGTETTGPSNDGSLW